MPVDPVHGKRINPLFFFNVFLDIKDHIIILSRIIMDMYDHIYGNDKLFIYIIGIVVISMIINRYFNIKDHVKHIF